MKDYLDSEEVVNEYKKAVDASSIFSISDLHGNILYANDQFLKTSGYSLKELLGKPHSIVRHPDMPRSAFKELWNTIKQKKIWRGTVKNKKKNGEAYYVDATIVPILDEDQNIKEYAGIRHDITELVNKTDQLRDMKNREKREDIEKALELNMDLVLETIPFATILIDEHTCKILKQNNLFSSLFAESPCLSLEEPLLEDFLVEDEAYLFSNSLFSFYDAYELSSDDEKVVGVVLDGVVNEFSVGVTQKEDGILICFVKKNEA